MCSTKAFVELRMCSPRVSLTSREDNADISRELGVVGVELHHGTGGGWQPPTPPPGVGGLAPVCPKQGLAQISMEVQPLSSTFSINALLVFEVIGLFFVLLLLGDEGLSLSVGGVASSAFSTCTCDGSHKLGKPAAVVERRCSSKRLCGRTELWHGWRECRR